MRELSTFSPGQVPRHLIRDLPREVPTDEFPIFVEFLKSYYEFLKQYTVNLEQIRDVSVSPDALLSFLKDEFAAGFGALTPRIDDRRFIELVRHIYKEKGTVSALELLMRIFFEDVITVDEPSKQILRASDGKWEQEYSILVNINYQQAPLEGLVTFYTENAFGGFFVTTERYVYNNDNTIEFFYKPTRRVDIARGQIVSVLIGGKTVFSGTVAGIPSKLDIVSPGKSWRPGQVFVVPGDTSDTFARVLRVDSNGGIVSVEIIDFGEGHTENEGVVVSPYLNRPSASDFDLNRNIIGYDTLTESYIYEHSLTLTESTNGTYDSSVGYSVDDTVRYFLEDTINPLNNYAERGYVGLVAFAVFQDIPSAATISTVVAGLTLEEWLESRAQFRYVFDSVKKQKGAFVSEDGHISTPFIRLQDNYFYQAFSYVINTSLNIEQYKPIVELLHPAGLKFFSSAINTSEYDIDRSVSMEMIENQIPQ